MARTSDRSALSVKGVQKIAVRQWFTDSLVKNRIDPLRNLASLLDDPMVDGEIKARINIELLKLLVPKPKEERLDSTEQKKLVIEIKKFGEVAKIVPVKAETGVIDLPAVKEVGNG